MRRLTLWAAAVSLSCTAVMMVAPAAQASPLNNVCGNRGSGYCLNAWNGGPYVKMYYGGNYGNDQFYLIAESACQGQDYVTAVAAGDALNCPFSNVKYDNEYEGDGIDAIYYVGSFSSNSPTYCVGTGNLNGLPDVGYLGACGDGYGDGIIQGGLFVQTSTTYCIGGVVLINKYWTNQDAQPAYAYSGGNPGQPLYVGANGSGTCWGGSGV
jgi:hypothetical protein